MNRLQRIKTILTLGLPIVGGMLSQSVLNLADAAMVGRLGETALAGIGVGGYINFLAVSLILGLSSGVQALVARRRGQSLDAETATPLGWGIIVAFAIALPLTLLFFINAEWLITLLSEDIQVEEIAANYFNYRVLALLAVGLNLSFRGYWNGTNRPVVYLRILLMVQLLNVLISYTLIFGYFGLPAMGAPGAGLGTAISLYLGAVLLALVTLPTAIKKGMLNLQRSNLHQLKSLLRLAVPHSIQQFLFATSMLVLFWIIGLLGTTEQAIGHVLINLALLLILPGVGLGVACTTLVSHALGQNDPNMASRWGWDVILTAILIMLLLSLPMWLYPDSLLGLFLATAEAIDKAHTPLMLTGLAICLDAAAIVLTQALLGAGANRVVMLISSLGQWVFYLPLAWLIGPFLGYGLTGIWLLQTFHRAGSSLIFIYIWKRRNWVHIRI
ncbi:MATE family efflux transporter [Amphritea pacifica]|uniref:Multidrug-efflux transporter n=1 Tax=Amphritea pacifica TaxID=2811233 RepID=A0ABS2W6G3_9GAMM|nr:MATE family efflux transporter [Amphritea pacifica]MBN0987102.1 MATE family efflux transporter [Amphritea pacifica]MBN1007892.1 MATE family efflux transporter [Amphritea pacifica]